MGRSGRPGYAETAGGCGVLRARSDKRSSYDDAAETKIATERSTL